MWYVIWTDMEVWSFLFFDILELEDYLQPQMFEPKVGGWIQQISGNFNRVCPHKTTGSRNGFPGYAIKDRPWQSDSSSHLFLQFHTCFLDVFSLEDVRCCARPCRLLLHWRWGWDFMLDAVDEKKHHHLTSQHSYVFSENKISQNLMASHGLSVVSLFNIHHVQTHPKSGVHAKFLIRPRYTHYTSIKPRYCW